MAEYWFKPKRYGWGTVPSTWQGWLATFSLVGLITVAAIADVSTTGNSCGSVREWLRFALDVIILTALFIILFKDKVEGELRWRWGGKR